MPKYLYALAGATALMFAATVAHAAKMTAQEFVTKASTANMFEIESSKLALKKSSSDDVKAFAQRMVDDHSKTGDKLGEVLKSSDSKAMPATQLDEKHLKLMDKLNAVAGADFDDKYISLQKDAHKEAVDLFGDYAKKGDDAALKQFASDTLPTLKDHHDNVKRLDRKH